MRYLDNAKFRVFGRDGFPPIYARLAQRRLQGRGNDAHDLIRDLFRVANHFASSARLSRDSLAKHDAGTTPDPKSEDARRSRVLTGELDDFGGVVNLAIGQQEYLSRIPLERRSVEDLAQRTVNIGPTPGSKIIDKALGFSHALVIVWLRLREQGPVSARKRNHVEHAIRGERVQEHLQGSLSLRHPLAGHAARYVHEENDLAEHVCVRVNVFTIEADLHNP
mmetsp:Transcript_258/g.495  ORF Transcript_258/g.495 Transcript_258/m.495 type:complete len:222 (-) Transcript_258:1005-1670(-)